MCLYIRVYVYIYIYRERDMSICRMRRVSGLADVLEVHGPTLDEAADADDAVELPGLQQDLEQLL